MHAELARRLPRSVLSMTTLSEMLGGPLVRPSSERLEDDSAHYGFGWLFLLVCHTLPNRAPTVSLLLTLPC